MRLIRILKYDLCKEVANWVKEGIISSNQAESICSQYGIDFNNMSRRSYGYNVLMGLGCLFIGLSLITLIGTNWEEIPRALRMSALVALTLATYTFGLIKFRKGQKNQAVTLFFLGGLFYGASIMLIAQIYHIGEHFPDGVFWWAIGILPIALLLESTLIMMLALCLAFIWFFIESYLNFYPTLFPIFLAATFWHLNRIKQSNILFLLLIVGAGIWSEYTLAWFMSSKSGFDMGVENVALGMSFFVFLHGLAKWLLGKKDHILSDYGTLLGLWVLRFIIITLLIFSFKEPWEGLINTEWNMSGLIITLSILLCTLSLWLSYQSGKSLFSTIMFILLFNISLLSVIFIKDQTYEIVFQVADNIVLVGVGIYLVIRGIQHSISQYFYVGVFAILITGLLRYIDLIGDYIGASILFAILAAILLLSARYWKKHQTNIVETS